MRRPDCPESADVVRGHTIASARLLVHLSWIVEFLENRKAWSEEDQAWVVPFRGSTNEHVVVGAEARTYVLVVPVGNLEIINSKPAGTPRAEGGCD
jgi:hypothetical protein